MVDRTGGSNQGTTTGEETIDVPEKLAQQRITAPAHAHSARDAIRAPSARLLNLAQTISGSISGR